MNKRKFTKRKARFEPLTEEQIDDIEKNIRANFGLAVKRARRAKQKPGEDAKGHISQRTLGEAIGCSLATVERIESGEAYMTITQLYWLCKYLNVSADELLGLNDGDAEYLSRSRKIDKPSIMKTAHDIYRMKPTHQNIAMKLLSDVIEIDKTVNKDAYKTIAQYKEEHGIK